MIEDPRFAPRRDDLPFLRRRRHPRPAASAGAAAAAAAPAAAPPAISFDRPGRQRAAPAPAPPAPVPAQSAPTISFDRPGRSRATPAPAPPASSSLDLDAPAAPPPAVPPAASPDSSLDLDGTPAPEGPIPATPPAGEPARRVRQDARVVASQRVILTVTQPTVTLTRLQSAIGTLTVEAAVSAAVGDMRLGCAYELGDGYASTVQLTDGNRFAPPRGRRPVIVASREHFDRLAIDLRQSTDLRRFGVYAFSVSRQPLQWGGTLIVTTFGGAKVELPLEALSGGSVAMLLSAYNVRGEFVLRGEMQSFNGGVRAAVRAYGYDRITWLDDRTPVE